ncbi:MAG: polyphosphate kinase 2 [Pseudomonadales bacterium]|jgi:polyphosphate kinase 2|nr:polyphosphate kinase 2 [Pseudomonadales bacterium]
MRAMTMTHDLIEDIPLETLIDSLEADSPRKKTEGAVPLEPGQKVTKKLIRKYFNEVIYPYREHLSMRDYYDQKIRLQIELVKLQNWIRDEGKRVVLVFEGRDAAGKGSTIRAFMEHLNPRWSTVVALEKPTEEERGQWYFQRYVKELPSAGEIAFFDRSWYNRAGVERVMGFCTEKDYEDFLEHAPIFEKMLVKSGITIIKFYLSVSKVEQARRFEERKTNPLKQWKLSPIDLEAQHKWDGYTAAKNTIFESTDSEEAPWVIVKTEQKTRGRLEAMRFVLNQFDYPNKDPDMVASLDPLIISRVSRLLDKEGHSNIIED